MIDEIESWRRFYMKKHYSLFLIIIIGFLLVLNEGCSKNAVNVFSKGEFYRNDSFGVTIKIPDNWYVKKKEGKDIDAAFEANAKHKFVTLLHITKYLEATPERCNVVFMSGVEKVTDINSKSYLLHMKKLYEEDETKGKLKCFFNKDIYTRKIGGIDFDVLEFTRNTSNEKVTVIYYAAFIKDNMYIFSTVSVTEEEATIFNQILDSIKFVR
jgi:hypothetical protein